jgi:hypothetical protein
MNKDFIPLSLSGGPRPGGAAVARSKEAAATQTPTPFRPLGGSAPTAQAPLAPGGEPKITLERQGDRVTRITVQCPCGRVTELVCSY